MDSCFVVFNTLISNNCQICIFSRPGSPIHIHGHWLSDKVTATILVNGEHVQGLPVSSVVQCPLVVHFRLHALVQKLCSAPSAGVLWTQLEGIVPNWIWEEGRGGWGGATQGVPFQPSSLLSPPLNSTDKLDKRTFLSLSPFSYLTYPRVCFICHPVSQSTGSAF